MRQLSLHVSALNDLEYSAYTGALHDLIADDQSPSDDYGNVSVGVREVRAWLRGRYASMPLSDINDILKLFYPTLSPQDIFNAGQFFAVMRLVTHAGDGKGISKTLAFTQAHPRNDSGRPPSRPTSQSPSEQPLPPHPSRHNGRGASYMTSISDQNPFRRDDHRGADHTLPPPPYSTYNPFVPRPNFEGRPPDQGELPSNNVTNFCDSPSSRPWIGGGSSRSALEEQPTIELMSTGYIDSPNLNQVGDGGFIIHSNPRTSPSDGGYREGTVTQESVDRWTRSLTAMFTEDSSNSIRPSPPSSSNGDETNPFQMPYGNGFAQTISLNDIDI